MDKYIGKRLDGRYLVDELVGIGGMANVYKATDVSNGRIVAVKILRDEYVQNGELLRRFKNESKAVALLSHPNIVRVYDVNFSDRVNYPQRIYRTQGCAGLEGSRLLHHPDPAGPAACP